MDISGRQLRRLKELLPKEEHGEFEKIFPLAFKQTEVTRETEIKISWYYNWAQLVLVHGETEVAKIHISSLHQEKRFYEKHPNYVIDVHNDGTFKVYKLID